MKLCRCPICHSDLTQEALVEDDSGRELLKTITEMTAGCGRPAVAYLGLFKPPKSSLSNGRALRILQSLLDLYDCSPLLAHALAETVEQVRKNRRETGRCEPLANHNYLKKVYESNKLMFAPTNRSKSVTPVQRLEEDKKRSAIEYIQRLVGLGQEEHVKHLPEYKIWQKWKQEQENVRTNS